MISCKLCKTLALPALCLAGVLIAANDSSAMDTFYVGPRAMAMSGAVVAAPTDTAAQYYNPAAFGFFAKDVSAAAQPAAGAAPGEEMAADVDNNDANDGSVAAQPTAGAAPGEEWAASVDNNDMGRKKFGLDLNAGVGYRLHNNFGKYLDALADIDIDQLSSGGINSESDLRELTSLIVSLDGLDKPGNAITTDANAALGARVGHFGVGAFGSFQATATVLDVDTINLGVVINRADLTTDINNVELGAGYVNDGNLTVFTTAQRDAILAALGGASAATLAAVDRLDYLVSQEALGSTDIQGVVDMLTAVVTNSGPGASSLENNTSTVLLKGFGVVEVPITYGYAISDNLSVGGNVKFMKGRVYGNEVIVFNDGSDDVLAQTDEFYAETNTFGLDLGVMYRIDNFNFGLVGRNLNSPKFDGPTIDRIVGGTLKVDDVRIDPQFAVGAAWIPFKTLTLEADLDLTENETTLADYSTRNLAIGLEWDAFRVLALRLGAHKNLSEDDIGWVYSGGVGLNLWLMRLDVAGAFSADKEQFDNEDIPKETRVSAQLSFDF
jgi:hypothetical protein